MNAFDGPHGRPNPTFGREPRFFGGGCPEPQDKQPFGPDIERILQTFRDEPQHGGRPDMNKVFENVLFV
jgi:hypothetical protein